MPIDPELISHLAKLARLSPSPEQAARLENDLRGILTMVEQLDKLDLGAVEPLRYVTGQSNDFRPDETGSHLDRSQALRNAPDADVDGGFFRVPRVIGD